MFKDFDECVQSGDPECQVGQYWNKVEQTNFVLLRLELECMDKIYNCHSSVDPMSIASIQPTEMLYNWPNIMWNTGCSNSCFGWTRMTIIHRYAAVGVLEHMNKSLDVLEAYLPGSLMFYKLISSFSLHYF